MDEIEKSLLILEANALLDKIESNIHNIVDTIRDRNITDKSLNSLSVM